MFAIALTAWVIFASTIPQNHTAAEDAYAYANAVEKAPFDSIGKRHHLLYVPLMAGVLSLCRALGYEGRAFPLLIGLSIMCGGILLVLAYRATELAWNRPARREAVHRAPFPALLAASMLGCSYGVWRYAGEAEIVVPALTIMFGSLGLAMKCRRLHTQMLTGLAAGIGILFHAATGITALIVAPMVYLLRRLPRAAIIHVACAGLVAVAGYALLFRLGNTSVLPDMAGQTVNHMVTPLATTAPDHPTWALSWRTLAKGSAALGQALLSGNFLFGLPLERTMLTGVFADRLLIEEIYMGRAMTGIHAWLGVLTFTVALGLGLWSMIARLRLIFTPRRHQRRPPLAVFTYPLLAWVLVYGLVVLLYEPGNPELWVYGSAPLVLLFVAHILTPLWYSGHRRLVITFLIVFALHNCIGGMSTLGAQGNYHRAKAAPVLEHAHQGVLLTAGGYGFATYLGYHSSAEVIDLFEDLRRHNAEAVNARLANLLDLASRERPVFITGDVFDPPAPLSLRFPRSAGALTSLAKALAPHAHRIVADPWGGLYRIAPTVSLHPGGSR